MQLFGDFENKYRDYGKAKFAILPVPYDKTSTWVKGADKGPDAFLEASFALENYDVETETEAYKAGIATLKPVLEDKTPELLCSAVERETAKLLNDGKFPIMIGGNHTCSIGSIRAMASRYKNLTILQLDAHSDLRPEYEGTELNHACVMYQAQKLCPITQVGIRSQCVEELPYVKKERTFYAHNIFDNNNWQSKAIDTLSENVYITIDLDVFDPSVLPSTGTPEPGGLTYYQVLHFLRSVIKERNVVGFDIVELCPNPTDKASDYLAARLCYQLITYRYNAFD